jgi:hypothetical protein
VGSDALYALIPILSVVFGCPVIALLGMLCFPSTRTALARRLAGQGAGALDNEAMAHVVATEANVTALRSEVYALRLEVAALTRALPGTQAPAPPQVGAGGR